MSRLFNNLQACTEHSRRRLVLIYADVHHQLIHKLHWLGVIHTLTLVSSHRLCCCLESDVLEAGPTWAALLVVSRFKSLQSDHCSCSFFPDPPSVSSTYTHPLTPAQTCSAAGKTTQKQVTVAAHMWPRGGLSEDWATGWEGGRRLLSRHKYHSQPSSTEPHHPPPHKSITSTKKYKCYKY